MEKELEFNGKVYISSKRAGEITGYTHDYIGQLCRAGKVAGQLVGRTRFVDKESLLAHIEGQQSVERNIKPITPLSGDDQKYQEAGRSVKISLSNKDISSGRDTGIYQNKFPTPVLVPSIPALTTVGNLSGDTRTRRIPAAYVSKIPLLFPSDFFRHAILFMVILSVTSGGYGYWKYGIAPESAFVSLSSSQNKTSAKEDHRGLVAPYTATFSPGFIPGASLQGAVGTSLSEQTLSSFVRVFVKNGIDRLAVGTYRALHASLTFGKERVSEIFRGKETLVLNDTPVPPKPSSTQNGLIVIPSSGDATSEKEERERIKEHFSDEVVVIPDETGGAGVIQPVFKSNKDEQYSFVLVPVKR